MASSELRERVVQMLPGTTADRYPVADEIIDAVRGVERRRILEELTDLDIAGRERTGEVLADDVGYYEHEWSLIRRIVDGASARELAPHYFAGWKREAVSDGE